MSGQPDLKNLLLIKPHPDWRRIELMRGFIQAGEQTLAHFFNTLRIPNFLAENILHIKGVGNLVNLGRYLGDTKIQPQITQRPADTIQHTDFIMGIDVENGILLRHLIVDIDATGDTGA